MCVPDGLHCHLVIPTHELLTGRVRGTVPRIVREVVPLMWQMVEQLIKFDRRMKGSWCSFADHLPRVAKNHSQYKCSELIDAPEKSGLAKIFSTTETAPLHCHMLGNAKIKPVPQLQWSTVPLIRIERRPTTRSFHKIMKELQKTRLTNFAEPFCIAVVLL